MADAFKPFADDDTRAATIGGLAVENGTDRVSLSGSLDIARDRQGLVQARALYDLMGRVVAALEAEKDLPEQAAAPKPVAAARMPNPWA